MKKIISQISAMGTWLSKITIILVPVILMIFAVSGCSNPADSGSSGAKYYYEKGQITFAAYINSKFIVDFFQRLEYFRNNLEPGTGLYIKDGLTESRVSYELDINNPPITNPHKDKFIDAIKTGYSYLFLAETISGKFFYIYCTGES